MITLEEHYAETESVTDLFKVLDEITPIKRTIAHLYETLQIARQTVSDEVLFLEMRDEAYMISRACDLLYQDMKKLPWIIVSLKIPKNKPSKPPTR